MLNVKKIALIIATVAIAACTNSDGDKYVGKWTNIGDSDITLEIVKNEDGKTFTMTDRMTFMGKPNVDKYPAAIEDNRLMMKTWAGKKPLFIDKDGTLHGSMGRNCPKCDLWSRDK